MKTVKRTEVGSFTIDMAMYTKEETISMLENDTNIFYLSDNFDSITNSENYHGEELRINHSACAEVRVVHNKKYDVYMNVVKTFNGDTYYIVL